MRTEILQNLQGVVRQMIEHEHTARGRLQEVSMIQLEDRVTCSYGALAHSPHH